MVKAIQSQLRNKTAASRTETTKNPRFLATGNTKINIEASADATTIKPLTGLNTKKLSINQVNCVRKCYVRLKRLKLRTNNTAAQKCNVNKSASGNGDNLHDVSVFEPGRNSTMCQSRVQDIGAIISPCRVRIRRAVQKHPETSEKAQENMTVSKRVHRFFHRDQPPARSRSSVTRHVYEFLSQSQIEDNEPQDPAADIIKQMVEDGRACVMVRNKGKTRKRTVKKKVRPVGKRKQCSVRNIAEKQPNMPSSNKAPGRQLTPVIELDGDSSDDNMEAVHVEVPAQIHTPPAKLAAAIANRTNIEGAYSPLARSLMLNQTKAHHQQPQESMERRRELLNMAKKFVSTPVNRKNNTVASINTTKFSPILDNASSRAGSLRAGCSPGFKDSSPAASAGAASAVCSSGRRHMPLAASAGSPSGGCSPWRVSDEVPLPNTFSFGLNTSNLPSYSSDFIRSRHIYVPDEPEPAESSCPAPNEQETSCAANDSNGENMPPPVVAVAQATPIKPSEDQENENFENYVQLPNPRRTLQHRSPLKDINILEVVVLPSWKKNAQPDKTPTKVSTAKNQNNVAISSPREQSARAQQPPCNLFGFEDFLDEEDEENANARAASQNVTLHEKLQRLKGLRPAEEELPQTNRAPLRHDYDDLQAREPKQRNIKEMLCSTMIGTPARVPSTDESVALFKDNDPEVTFDEKQPRRTYVRERPKRKRKQRVHVLFIDSDSSDEEGNEQDSKDKSGESPRKAMPPQKRTRKDVEHEAKLQQFITSFNQECAEVERFPVIVE
ncbi:protein dalmatian [Drosophila novamexicana]|uniref:protein dalmatian n=1 Tax=Drosophila novamexicana TaxID=47314 RepID=UPI0011E58C72|nr:protein dalmatian [Drosophila novamexicana]